MGRFYTDIGHNGTAICWVWNETDRRFEAGLVHDWTKTNTTHCDVFRCDWVFQGRYCPRTHTASITCYPRRPERVVRAMAKRVSKLFGDCPVYGYPDERQRGKFQDLTIGD